MTRHHRQVALATSLIALAWTSSAGAQTSGQATADSPATSVPADATDRGIGDIVVTARKRSENLQDVPASILAIGQQQLANLNAKTLSDLNGATPNVRIADDGTLSIRGISSNARNAGFEAGAATYIDGVYQGRPLGNNQDLVDVARVEFLRGPQGTLYGKNTTAGAISIVTARPGDQWAGRVEAQYAELDDRRISGYAAGPLAPDLLGLKLSAYRRKSDGYQINLADRSMAGYQDTVGGRGELRLTSGPWDIAVRGDYTDDRSLPATQEPVSGFAAVFSPGRDVSNADHAFALRTRGGGASLTIDRRVGEFGITSISAWRTQRTSLRADDDFSPADIVYHDWEDRSRQISQELRISSPSSGRLSYVVGAYYYWQVLDTDRPVILSTGFPVQSAFNDIVKVKTDAVALFGNADYHVLEALTLNLGLRYTNEHKILDFVQLGVPAIGYPFLTIQDAFTDTDLSPTASLSYKISPAATIYAKFSKGFKSGGWNPDITTTPNIRFKDENVKNYEAGLRTRLLNDRLGINVTGYIMDYNNLQVSQFVGTFAGYVITNAGSARIKGAELELQARPADWLSLSVGGAYNDARYRRFDTGLGTSYAGQQFTNTPRVTAFTSVDVRRPIGTAIDLVSHADVRYQSKVYFDDQRTIGPVGAYAQDPYALVNLRIGIVLHDIEITAFAQNLTNKRYLVNRASDALGLGLVLDRYSPPRQVGGRVMVSF